MLRRLIVVTALAAGTSVQARTGSGSRCRSPDGSAPVPS
jgi:hypothetical protein